MKKKLPYPACEYLPSNIIEKMKEEIIESDKDKLEHGFQICSSAEYWGGMNDKNTTISARCIGTKCQIRMTGKGIGDCPPKTSKIAIFHTHPKSRSTLPSFNDVRAMHLLEYKFGCIGSNRADNTNKATIRCFSRNITTPPVYIDIPSKKYNEFRKIWEESAEYCTIDIGKI